MSGKIVNYKDLQEHCKRIIETSNVPQDEAELIAEHLVDAELLGVTSHGVSRTSIYVKRINEGVVKAKCEHKVDNEAAASIAWDACNSMGMVTGVRAMERCIEKAKESGCCFVAVRNSNHFGMAGYYARMAAEAGMIGFCGTNAPPNIAPWGSYQAYSGTNPLAIAAPRTEGTMVFDMAPSVVAMGKVIMAAKLGKSIPEGWAITADGNPTTDPNEGMKGTVLPIGGPKGYGLALFMDILCGIMAGADFGPHLHNMWDDFENPQNVGHVFCAIDITKFTNLDSFKTRVDQMVGEIKELPKNPGVETIFMPGELEVLRKRKAQDEGVQISDVVYNELVALAATCGVEAAI